MKQIDKLVLQLNKFRNEFVLKSTKLQSDSIQGAPEYVPAEYFEFLTKIGGVNDYVDDRNSDILPCLRMLTLEKALEIYRSSYWKDNFDNQFFPIMENYSSDFLSIGQDSGIYFVLHDAEPVRMYDDFNSMVTSMAMTYESGGYFVNDDGWLEVDENIERKVGQKCNRDAEFWTEFGNH